ncbi:hypothetical protein Syun_016926 [Stephania yunnanensis]|uniref:Uncharacterized protein n=1 Tax=Stephania yunnanensis TaxID=152371 RepID=A0AAP0J604_9MAGN
MREVCSKQQDSSKIVNSEIPDSSSKLERLFRQENIQLSKYFKQQKLFLSELAFKRHLNGYISI